MIFLSVLFFQCQKEVSYIGGPDPVIVAPEPITARLQGTVFNEAGQPAQNVTVKVGNQTAMTDARGYFRIMNAPLDKKSSVVTAEKSGYFKAYRTFSATSGTNQVVIKLVPKTLAGTIDAASGGNVTLTNGSKVALPANAVVRASNNAAYTGTINVYAAYIDPTAADIDQTVPGSFMANDINGSRVILSSYGMMAVELESTAGDKLQIKSGAVASLTTPIPASVQATAPQTIALWSVDEQTGIWEEEGTATKQGNVYVGDVKHFSFWNCDVSVNAVHISMTVKNSTGQPLVYAHVKLKRTTGNLTQTHGWTDSLGQVSGYVPNNEVLLLEVVDQCNNVLYSQNIGPFTQSTNIGVITVSNSATGLITVTGKLLDCSSNPVTNGMALIYYGSFTAYASTDATGNFSSTFTTCSSAPATLDILGIDNAALVQSNLTTVNVTTPSTNTGNINVCGTSAQEYINYTLDGTSYTIANTPADSLDAWTSSQGTTQHVTFINAFQMSTNNGIYFSFSSPSLANGTYAMMTLGVQTFNQVSIVQPSTVTMTNFPTVPGQYYEGTFTAQFNSGGAHTLTGNFRIRK